MQRDVEVAVERVEIPEPPGVQVRGVAHDGDRAGEEPARRAEARDFRQGGWREKACGIREVILFRDWLESGDRIERASKEFGKIAVAEATRLKVESAQRPFNPADPLLKR